MAQDGRTFTNPDDIERATFTDKISSEKVEVHFNPDSLSLSVTTNQSERGDDSANKQYVSQSTTTLSMVVLFDTTESGEDVRNDTIRLQKMMGPAGESGQVATTVLFHWGAMDFEGVIESYSETISFFSATGVPLRSSVNLEMLQQDKLFAPGDDEVAGSDSIFEINAQAGGSVSAAIGGGDSGTIRAVAEFNGESSLRLLSGPTLQLDGSAELRPPAVFATGSTGFSLGGGVGIGLELGLGGAFGAGGGLNAGSSPSSSQTRLQLASSSSLPIGSTGNAPFGNGSDIGVNEGLGGNTAFGGNSAFGRNTTFGANVGSGDNVLATANSFSSSPPFGSPAASADGSGLTSDLLSPGQTIQSTLNSGGSPNALGMNVALADSFGSVQAASGGGAPFTSSDPQPPKLEGPQIGGGASGGVPAVFGAFGGLDARKGPPRVRRHLDPRRLSQRHPEAALHADPGSSFDIGGRAISTQGSGLSADVGANASLMDRIRFDEE